MTIGAGKILGKRYQILSELGAGGFGKTFLAVDLHLPSSNRCVVKQLQPNADDDFTLETARRLFQKEAEILQQLGDSPQIPQLFAYFEEEGQFYLVQEYIEGHELASELTHSNNEQIIRQKYNEERTIDLLQEILEVLQYVHQNNVIHRDLNPHNLIRRHSDNKLVIIDFGAVKQITSQATGYNGTDIAKKRLTVSIGTLGYLPSEQANGNPRFSSDIYAVGIIGIQALTGCLAEELKMNPQTGELEWQYLIENIRDVSSPLINFLDRSIRYDYRQRYASSVEALQAIQKLQGNPNNPTISNRSIANQTITKATIAVPYNSPARKTFAKKLKQILLAATVIALSIGSYTTFDLFQQHQTVKELYQQANALYDLKRYQEAYTMYEKVLQAQPKNGAALRGKADTLQKLNRDRDALVNYEKAIQIDPKDWQAWLGRARSQIKLGLETEAIETLKTITTNEPSNYFAWGELAQLYLKKEQYAEAIDPLGRIIRATPNDASLRYQKGWALYNIKQYKDAQRSYEEAIDLKPDYSQAWYQKGNTLIRLEKYDEAVESYTKAVEFDPKYTSAWYAKANILKSREKYEEALEAYKGTTDSQPSFWQAWYDRGKILHQLQRYEEAITDYDRALKYNPNNYLIWYGRGNSAYNFGNYELAVKSYQKTIALKTDFLAAQSSLGNALLNNRQYSEAIVVFDRILKGNPNDEKAQQGKALAEERLQETSPAKEDEQTENTPNP
jgi:serine/threonine protein kinase/lipoprotein NlpI